MMRFVLISLILVSCAPREITRIEKIKTRTIDTTVITPPDIIYAVRPLTFFDTIVVENERVRTEVIIDTVLNTVDVTSEVKPYEHTVKATETIQTKTKQKETKGIFPWYVWYLLGVVSVVFIQLFRKL